MALMDSTPRARPDRPRRLFMILSPRSLPYANLALKSLFGSVREPIDLSLVTDSLEDQKRLEAELAILKPVGSDVRWKVYSASDLDAREEAQFGPFEHLRGFRRGHPCWRKVTDPLLLSVDGEEMVLLDPDIYFPNRFRFEQTTAGGVSLMWQKPCCLLPPEVVQKAIDAKVGLAHHVDIGVAQWRAPVDLEWLNWLIGTLGGAQLPRSMHVEAIVWAALAMRIGGGYLDHRLWVCWHRTQYKRALRKIGVDGVSILRRENLSGVKCFHAGGEAKWWLPDADKLGILDRNEEVAAPRSTTPFIELTPAEYDALQRNRRWLRRLGYYSVFKQ